MKPQLVISYIQKLENEDLNISVGQDKIEKEIDGIEKKGYFIRGISQSVFERHGNLYYLLTVQYDNKSW